MQILIFIVGLSFIYWFISQLDWHQVSILLLKIDPGEMVIWISINLVIFLLFCTRTWLIFREIDRSIGFVSLAKNRLVGFAVSYITPGPLVGGEPLQVYLLKKVNNIPTASATSALFIDRYIDVLANFTFIVIATAMLFWDDISLILSLTIALFFFVYISVMIFYIKKITVISFLAKKIYFLQRFYSFFHLVETQIIAFLHQAKMACLQLFFLCILIWGMTIYEVWFILHALDLNPSVVDTITVLLSLRLVLLTPFPGGMGVLESSQMWVIQYLGFDKNASAITTLLVRSRDACFTICGLCYWKKFSRHLKERSRL
ncbi:lysylphosphatidylglycerol synthase transmembrane domain-containing protein [Candidatus Uabimicrobium amorphum]|uniref:TIGR00374 family protein n=1 Tax=Uabimicrobium amorphum TaxID=2596890 RepID=A0A5S9F5S9_UABAM|nr:lysylphosphatidylglycerol synthase transmembrane domain-containing protein [Candidatus Uabimicrobium amorphum]BBM86942.1 hypothetical protein UABAM_05344 [Candidatus Uabimicrobium amorphum]